MKLGTLTFDFIKKDDSRLPYHVATQAFDLGIAESIYVAEVDPSLADTVDFCKHYRIDLGISTNCLVIEAKRGERVWYGVCLVLATDSADVNGMVRKQLDARKTSFASKDIALQLTGMEFGGITPIGLPGDWFMLIDEAVMRQEVVVIGGGFRRSKVAIKTEALRQFPQAIVMDIKKQLPSSNS